MQRGFLLFSFLVLLADAFVMASDCGGNCECLNRCKYNSKLCKKGSEQVFDCVQRYLAQRDCHDILRNCSDGCLLGSIPNEKGCCENAGLPRSAQEYFTLNKKKPVKGSRVPICIDQGGAICHYPIKVVAGVQPNGTVSDYLQVKNSTNYVLAGCQTNCNTGGGTPCPGYNYPSGHPEITFYWNAVKFDPFTLVVDVRDSTYARSNGCFITWNTPFRPYGWGYTWNCDGGGPFASEFMIDLTDSPFQFNTTTADWVTEGFNPNFSFKTNTNLKKFVSGFGYCAQIEPRDGILQLGFSPNAPIYSQ